MFPLYWAFIPSSSSATTLINTASHYFTVGSCALYFADATTTKYYSLCCPCLSTGKIMLTPCLKPCVSILWPSMNILWKTFTPSYGQEPMRQIQQSRLHWRLKKLMHASMNYTLSSLSLCHLKDSITVPRESMPWKQRLQNSSPPSLNVLIITLTWQTSNPELYDNPKTLQSGTCQICLEKRL